MGDSISDEVKGMYAKKKSELKEKAQSLQKEMQIAIEHERNESFKEVEPK